MRQVAIVTGVLGTGTAIVFSAAALVSTLFPSGTLVPSNPWSVGRGFERGGPVMVNDVGGDIDPDGGVRLPDVAPAVLAPGVAR